MMELGATLCAPSGRGTDPRDPLRTLYWSVRIGREAFAASKAGDLMAMLGMAGGGGGGGGSVDGGGGGGGNGEACTPVDQGAALGIHSCPACKNGAAPLLEALRSIAEGGVESEDADCMLIAC